MENDIYYVQLFDIYKGLLTEYQRDIFSLRYSLDMSFSEIAVETGASRQSAFDGIKKIKDKLAEYEKALGLKAKYDALEEFSATLDEKDRAAIKDILGR